MVAEGAKRIHPSLPIVFVNQNFPRPPKPYITLNVLNVDIPDHVIYSKPNPDDSVTISGWRRASVEIQVYNGIESLSTIDRLALILQSNSLIDYQATIDVSIGQRLFFGYVPELLNQSQFEGRGVYQFEFFYTEEYTDPGNSICEVELAGRYIGGASNPDVYTMFEPPPFPSDSLQCVETVPCPESLETIWDAGDTTWDNKRTTWDIRLP